MKSRSRPNREREREKQSEEVSPNMINAQEWLKQKFPTPGSKKIVKIFNFTGSRQRASYDNKWTPQQQYFFLPEVGNLAGELVLEDFVNLEHFSFNSNSQITKIKFVNCSKLNHVSLCQLNQLQKVEGLEYLTKLVYFVFSECPQSLPPYTFLEAWKQEIEELKTQLAEYEQPETTSDPSEPLNTKIQRKKAQLQQAITSGRKSTAPLRKEIELLEKIQTLETQVNTLQTKETNYQEQIRQKEAQIVSKQEQINALVEAKGNAETNLNNTITHLNEQLANLRNASPEDIVRLQGELTTLRNAKEASEQTLNQTIADLRQQITNLTNTSQQEKQNLQTQLTGLQTQLNNANATQQQNQRRISQLEKQIRDLTAEKAAIEEKMLSERQAVLAEWEKEKQTLQAQITQLAEQKDTFQKSADYLRSTLKDTEKNLEATQTQLANTEKQSQEKETNQQATLNHKEEELAKKQEAYALIQERNIDLQGKLSAASEEITKLTEWISKLEAASAEGGAWESLQQELRQARQENQTLQEQLATKSPPRSYWWVYVLVALVALYFLMN